MPMDLFTVAEDDETVACLLLCAEPSIGEPTTIVVFRSRES